MTDWEPDVCIYHGGCDDGFGAALAVHQRWGDDVEFIPAGYGNPSPDCTGKHVLIVDFSYKQDEMRRLASRAASVVVLDHHKTAKSELHPWTLGDENVDLGAKLQEVAQNLALNQMEGVIPVIAYFCMNKSGARMAWEFCFPGKPVPALIEHIEDRDLWRFAMQDTKAISAALRTYPHDFELWKMFLASTIDLVIEGQAVLRGHEKNVQSMIANRYWDTLAGSRVPMVNVPYHYASDCCDAMLMAEPDAPFCAAWFRRGDGQLQYSLRSRDDRMDVSEIAKQFGGGGHRNAAGFSVEIRVLENDISVRIGSIDWKLIDTLPISGQVLVTDDDPEDDTPGYGTIELAVCPILSDGRILNQNSGNYTRAGVWKWWRPVPPKSFKRSNLFAKSD